MEHDLWCSWCYNKGSMALLQHNFFQRNLYKCIHCAKETKHCTFCKIGMARVQVSEKSEFTCAVCDHSITNWGEKPVALVNYCSWCFTRSKQNHVSNDTFECENCHKHTFKCKCCINSTEAGMARVEGKECFKCSKKIIDWSNPEHNIASLSKTGWCSWCIEPSRHIFEEDGGLLARDTYSCSNCNGATASCLMCNFAFARIGDNWNEISCEICNIPKTAFETAHGSISSKIGASLSEKLSKMTNTAKFAEYGMEIEKQKGNENTDEVKRGKWVSLNQKKKSIMDVEFNFEIAKAQITRDSPEKYKAKKAGMIRPFLLLVSMHPALRTHIALMLGWCPFSSVSYSYSHQEALEILTMELKGMIPRANSLTQNIRPLAENCNYYDMLRKVADAVFHTSSAKELSTSESKKRSITPNDDGMKALECFFIENVADARKKYMTDEERIAFNAKRDNTEISTELAAANADILTRIATSNEEAREFCQSIVDDLVDPKEFVKDMVKNALLPKALQAHMSIGSAISAKFHFHPLMLAKRVYEGVNIVFGPTLIKLYGPLVCILSQRILLAAQKFEVDEYY